MMFLSEADTKALLRNAEQAKADQPGQVWLAVVEGEPAVKKRPRVFWDQRAGKMRAVTPQATHDAEAGLGWAMKAVWRQPADPKSLFGVSIRFVCSRHKNGNERRVDGDNALKACLDAGNDVVWKDDSQVRDVHYVVTYDVAAFTEITWWRL